MIENNEEFYLELQELYGKTVNKAYKTRVNKELEEISDNLLQVVYDEVTILHDASTTLPKLKDIVKAIQNVTGTKDFGTKKISMLSGTSESSLNVIIDRMKDLKGKCFDDMNHKEVDFMHDWDELYYCYEYLVDKEWKEHDIFEKLESIKIKIIDGQKIFIEEEEKYYPRSGMASFQEVSKNIDI